MHNIKKLEKTAMLVTAHKFTSDSTNVEVQNAFYGK
jgi:hypothetical protein